MEALIDWSAAESEEVAFTLRATLIRQPGQFSQPVGSAATAGLDLTPIEVSHWRRTVT